MSGRGKGSKRSLQDLYEHREEYKNLKWEMSEKRELARRKKMSVIPLAEIRGWCRKKYGKKWHFENKNKRKNEARYSILKNKILEDANCKTCGCTAETRKLDGEHCSDKSEMCEDCMSAFGSHMCSCLEKDGIHAEPWRNSAEEYIGCLLYETSSDSE
jgi:hypothetical protein